MSCSVIAGLVLLLSATSVVGTGDANSTECVSQQELAAVKAEMERRVDQLNSQLHYWQNTTVNILKDHCSSINTDDGFGSIRSGETVLVSTVFNITQISEEAISRQLNSLEDSINQKIKEGVDVIMEKMSQSMDAVKPVDSVLTTHRLQV
ncbi:hypothetical protein GBAR_LOCUS25294, partial [Geodia barretti]